MLKVMVVPDVHGSHEWEAVKDDSSVDFTVVLSDLVDAWKNNWPDQGENVINLVSWVREKPKKRILLFGNHDQAYVSRSRHGAEVSGHQWEHHDEICKLLFQARDVLRLAWECDGWVFSHAGFSKTAVDHMKHVMHGLFDEKPMRHDFASDEEAHAYYDSLKVWDEGEYSIDLLNLTFRQFMDDLYDDTTLMKWLDFNEALDWRGVFSGSGDEPEQFCLWIRPRALLQDAAYPKQVVGHTEYALWNEPLLLTDKKHDSQVMLFDSPLHTPYIFDTEAPLPQAWNYFDFEKRLAALGKEVNDMKSQGRSKEDFIEVFGKLGEYFYGK